ncbi:MAG: hypothetical protein GXP49_03135 [Deltaproteobacteria bacterium]|nr:hypothetical protein [Deltaproteobacteria bacterium]
MAAAWNWELDQGQCIGCGICADLCSYDAVYMPASQAYPAPVRGACIGCMLCVSQCPTEAVVVVESKEEEKREQAAG